MGEAEIFASYLEEDGIDAMPSMAGNFWGVYLQYQSAVPTGTL